ncbi:MAG: flagellar basal body L-ring protein FlgH [Bdellovibrio sp.]|nr:flagellar basal body L-ring protein FlgH [Bdellovibrio sp.]
MKIILLLFLVTGCASYIESLHRQMDKGSGRNTGQISPRNDKFDVYRKRRNGSNLVSTSTQKNIDPTVKRQYGPESEVKRRYTSDEIYDNGSDNSLWNGQGKDSFLFTQDSKKRQGDIILVNVMTRLKNDITAELKRVFPAPRMASAKKPKKKGKEKPGEEEKAEAETENKPEEPNTAEKEDEAIHDKISTVVIEEINRDHVLLSGRKNILFRNRKHLVEVQALVPRRNISAEDFINSDDIIETNITVLR